MSATLPTPRHFLTSLLNTISAIPAPTGPTNKADGPTNPLKNLAAQHKALLSTLHVLFPPPMLLQALDLLDRGLVTRLIQTSPVTPLGGDPAGERVVPPQAHVHLRPPPISEEATRQENENENGCSNTVYQVRSSQQPKSRFNNQNHNRAPSLSSGSSLYTVRLQAWNCSCAAFVFSAFPGYSSGSVMEDMTSDDGDGDGEWEFGGLSLDGAGSGDAEGNVPCCKHLLACLLAERWEAVLGAYVKVRRVGVEEMAGVGGES